jgi:cyclophilin family peptidyl-prolyl cis-trans isomerase
MAVCGARWGGVTTRLAVAAIFLSALLVGCKTRGPAKAKAQAPADQTAPTGEKGKDAKKDQAPSTDPLQRTFAEATRKDPPPDWEPPATTSAGKSVGTLYDQVTKAWDGIHFATPEGKRIVYHAHLDTELGNIELELRSDWAPNHVRNFIALAQAGYYDGLVFSRIVNQASKQSGDKVELIEGGSPQGVSETDQDGIGYWLKDEFNAKLPHEEGAVGASHGDEADTAACKFYIMLNKAPRLDGNYTLFARVTQGLDVARKISQQPVKKDEDASASEDQDLIGGDYRPMKPVVIRKVTIEAKEVDKEETGRDNTKENKDGAQAP